MGLHSPNIFSLRRRRAKAVLQTMQGRCFLLLISSSWCLVNVQAGITDSDEWDEQRVIIPGVPGGCLDGSSMVDSQQRGRIQLRDLKLNDSVLTYTPGVGSHFTEFLGWLTRSSSTPTLMLKISTSTNSSLTLTASHIVFRLSSKRDLESVYANQLVKGDRLVRLKSRDGAVELDEVVEIQVVWEEGGSWAPLTKEGSLVANRFLVSSFASFPHHICQQVSSFLRMFLSLDDEASQHEDGERQVVTASMKILEMFGLRGWIPPTASEMNKEVNTGLAVKVAKEKILRMSDHIEL